MASVNDHSVGNSDPGTNPEVSSCMKSHELNSLKDVQHPTDKKVQFKFETDEETKRSNGRRDKRSYADIVKVSNGISH